MVARPADHVVVERADDLHFPLDRAPHELAAAEQARLLAGERREDDRRRHRVPGEDPRRFQQGRRARRVVVRAGAHRDGIVVAAHDVNELRVDGALERGDDVRRLAAERAARREPLVLGRVAE